VLRALAEENAEELRGALQGYFQELEAQRYPRGEVEAASSYLVSAAAREFAVRGGDPCGSLPVNLGVVHAGLQSCDTVASFRECTSRAIEELLRERRGRREARVRSVIQKAHEYILRNYRRSDLSLPLVAESVSLSPSYLSKLYHHEMGRSYLDSITSLRIDESKRLLAGTNDRIADIGQAVGYPNPQYFCTLFKKVEGLSPAEYRESHRMG
jgi:two-component system response regulator YesN